MRCPSAFYKRENSIDLCFIDVEKWYIIFFSYFCHIPDASIILYLFRLFTCFLFFLQICLFVCVRQILLLNSHLLPVDIEHRNLEYVYVFSRAIQIGHWFFFSLHFLRRGKSWFPTTKPLSSSKMNIYWKSTNGRVTKIAPNFREFGKILL